MNNLLRLYKQSVRNVPILKYSWVLIATISILSLAAYFKLDNSDVFLYAIGVLIISLFGFIFSFMLRTEDLVVRIALYILTYSIVVTIIIAVGGFASFIIADKPEFYRRYFPDIDKKAVVLIDTTSTKDVDLQKKQDTSKQVSDIPITKTEKKPIRTPKKIENGFYENGNSGYLYQDGLKINFKKVIGNHTRSAGAVPPYYISEPLKNSTLIRYANYNACRTKIPDEEFKSESIESIYYDDAIGIANMLGLELPDMFLLINADLSQKITIGNKKELFFSDSTTLGSRKIPRSLGELYIAEGEGNLPYIADNYRAHVIPNTPWYLPEGRIRIIKWISRPEDNR